MCGRFALATDRKVLEMLYDLEIRAELPPRYNIAPSQEVLAVRLAEQNDKKEAAFFKWGLVPFWADDQSIGNKMINARAETAPQKPSFRNAFKKRRLLIPATGFFEWKKENGRKQPYYICRQDGRPFSLAGLWERWDKEEVFLESCTILTTEANSLIAPVHNRMPVIIPEEACEDWLHSPPGKSLNNLLTPYPAEKLTAYKVSRMVNNPAADSEELIEPV